MIKRSDGSEAARIREQQKILRNRMVRDNRLQSEMAQKSAEKLSSPQPEPRSRVVNPLTES